MATTDRHWTRSAVNCYLINGDCSRCDIPRLGLSEVFTCQMMIAVTALLEDEGAPNPGTMLKLFGKEDPFKDGGSVW